MSKEVTPLHLLNLDNYTEKDIREARYSICKSCDKIKKSTTVCTECGCLMALKTWLKDAYCPIGKWDAV
jgi:bacterioferritin-associated ferredoxin